MPKPAAAVFVCSLGFAFGYREGGLWLGCVMLGIALLAVASEWNKHE